MTIVKIENVSLRLSQGDKPVLRQLNYQITHGDFVILLGGNGAGKSSLLKLLHRQYYPDTGHIILKDKIISKYSASEFSQHVAVLAQNTSDSLFPSLTVYENYLLADKNKINDRRFFREYVSAFNPNLADKLDCVMTQLSGGEKQALALALCLLHPPSLLLLDEHTSALDPKTSEQIMQLTQNMIGRYNVTCVLTTHNLDIALNYGNKILLLREGEIYKKFENEEKYALTREILMGHYY
jgi:putative ABC transport system ATP-binding protein